MTATDTARAFHRFGLGPRAGDLARIGDDPRGAILAELHRPGVALLPADGLLATPAAIVETRRQQAARRAAQQSGAAPPDGGAMAGRTPGDAMTPGVAMTHDDAVAPQRGQPGAAAEAPNLYFAEIAARIGRVQEAEFGFVERLVTFWANHFAIEADKGPLGRGLVGAFEREAIRPNVLGRFEDLLLAATRHPAMLFYLDNAASVGPNSPAGLRGGRGLNENHARELLELHTVGVDGGYTQADVTALAGVLTGWTFGQRPAEDSFGAFVFRRQAHEPGDAVVMGRSYAENGVRQGEAVLADLAASPATARHVALKLARHFIADDPPPPLVARLAATYLDTGGDLVAVYEALLGDDLAWGPSAKLKSPQEFAWSAIRALDPDIDPPMLVRSLQALGQPIWNPPSPEGFHDDLASWLAPDAITTRLDVSERLGGRARVGTAPLDLVEAILGPEASGETRNAVRSAESPQQAMALLLMSPEFQRR